MQLKADRKIKTTQTEKKRKLVRCVFLTSLNSNINIRTYLFIIPYIYIYVYVYILLTTSATENKTTTSLCGESEGIKINKFL